MNIMICLCMLSICITIFFMFKDIVNLSYKVTRLTEKIKKLESRR
ncbi:hypothetical protein [Clostridium botulinum]|nr:hypothetical protein [Clostridium botulinum]